MKTRDDIISNVLKIDLLLSDYAQATESQEQKSILDTMCRYTDGLQDTRVSIMFRKLCESKNDIYVEILSDLMSEYLTELKLDKVA